MALTDSFPGPSGLTDSIEAGKDLAALLMHENGTPKAGMTWKSASNLLVARSDLRVDIIAFKAALVRDGAARLLANDATAQSPEFTVPTANSRIDVVYVKVGETTQGDSSDGPFFGILQGAPAAIPSKPALNIAGAVEVGTALIPSTATGTASAGVILTTTAPLTGAAGGNVPKRIPLTPSAGTSVALGKPLVLTVGGGWAYLEGAATVAGSGSICEIPAEYLPVTDKRFIASDNASFVTARAVTLNRSTRILFSSAAQTVHLDGIFWPVAQ